METRPCFLHGSGLSAVFPTPQHGEALLAGIVPDVARGAGLLLAEGIRLLELRGVLHKLIGRRLRLVVFACQLAISLRESSSFISRFKLRSSAARSVSEHVATTRMVIAESVSSTTPL